jgi:hypothetical protein
MPPESGTVTNDPAFLKVFEETIGRDAATGVGINPNYKSFL